MNETKVDVLAVMDRLIGNARTMCGLTGDQVMRQNIVDGEQARAAVAELILVTREVSADMRYLMGRASAEGHDSGQSLAQQTSAKIDAALARIGGDK